MTKSSPIESEKCDVELLRKLYWEQHHTIRQIAHELPGSRRLVRETLLRLGPLRTARKERKLWSGSFSGDDCEKGYMRGLRAGDVNTMRASRLKILARVSTTHQAMLELFQQTFAPYGQCIAAPREVFLTGYDWQIRVDLNNSFEFLMDEPLRIPVDRKPFYEFVAGLSDSDGSWCLFADKGKTACAFMISSESKPLLLQLKERLEKESFHAYVYLDKRKNTTKTMHGVTRTREIKLTKDLWRLDIHRREEVRMLARRLLPLSRHSEKRRKMCLILDENREHWALMAPKVEALRAEIREETKRTIMSAEIEYKAKRLRADKGGRRLEH